MNNTFIITVHILTVSINHEIVWIYTNSIYISHFSGSRSSFRISDTKSKLVSVQIRRLTWRVYLTQTEAELAFRLMRKQTVPVLRFHTRLFLAKAGRVFPLPCIFACEFSDGGSARRRSERLFIFISAVKSRTGKLAVDESKGTPKGKGCCRQ